jgi:hypothetical protein
MTTTFRSKFLAIGESAKTISRPIFGPRSFAAKAPSDFGTVFFLAVVEVV